MVAEHGDTITGGVTKAADFVDDKTGGRFEGALDKVEGATESAVDRLDAVRRHAADAVGDEFDVRPRDRQQIVAAEQEALAADRIIRRPPAGPQRDGAPSEYQRAHAQTPPAR